MMLPVLRRAAQSELSTVASSDLHDAIIQQFKLTEADIAEMMPSGKNNMLINRAAWATFYLRKALALATPERGRYAITDRGKKLLTQHKDRIDLAVLRQFEEIRDFLKTKKADGVMVPSKIEAEAEESGRAPLEQIESAHQLLRSAVRADLLQLIRKCTPAFFERLVIELLVKMGYGGSLRDAAQVVGKSGDGGIDGIIKEDKLGLAAIYVQAKRWLDKTVGRPDVQQFAGALAGNKATKGIFITTSAFTKEAVEFAKSVNNSKIVLIDGDELTELMIDHNVGVSVAQVYEVKRIDSDYFAEGE
jgi:restriction system protein